MDFIQAIILSVVEGLTEFLPISSTGHLILASNILKIPQTEFIKSFEIIIQLGAILAVVFLYWKKVITNTRLWPKLAVAFLPTGVIGLLFYKLIKGFLLGNQSIVLLALFIGGILLIILEKVYKQSLRSNDLKEQEHHISNVDQISGKQAFLIGLCQSVSIIPGVSRAAATIIGGMFLGLKRTTAVEFSFLLAIPTMAAATGLDLIESNFSFTTNEYTLLAVGLAGSFITALFAVKFLLKFVQTHTFIPFGIYRIILSLLFWIFVLK